MFDITSPSTRDEILIAFQQAEERGDEYWSGFDTADFFRPLGAAWSASENVRHLTKSTRPVTKALTLPRFLLRILFGAPRRASVSYEELRSRYQSALADGGTAGRFAPSSSAESDPGAWRERIMSNRARVHSDLLGAIRRWPEAALDRYQLPHPLLGKLTVREMLFFTLYHQLHHLGVVERRKSERAIDRT